MTNHLDLTKQFLISRLRDDFTTFTGYQKEFETVRNLLSRTVEYGESNSALVIGPPRSGKSTVSYNNILTFLIHNYIKLLKNNMKIYF